MEFTLATPSFDGCVVLQADHNLLLVAEVCAREVVKNAYANAFEDQSPKFRDKVSRSTPRAFGAPPQYREFSDHG